MEVERVLCQKSEGGKKKKIIKVKQKNKNSQRTRGQSPDGCRVQNLTEDELRGECFTLFYFHQQMEK